MDINEIFAEIGRLHLEVSQLNKRILELQAENEKLKVQKTDKPASE
jgi:uncharacterized small protein (DUF1192 family)